MDKVILFLYQCNSSFNFLFKITSELVIVTNIDQSKVSDLIELCNEEKLQINFKDQITISVAITEKKTKKNK